MIMGSINCIKLGIIVLALAQANAQEGAPRVKLSLRAVYERGLIPLRVSIENTSSESISVEISDRNPPFMISILDANGHDMYRPVYADLAKNRHNRTVNLRLVPHGSKTYSFDVAKVRDAKGDWSDLPPGEYQVQVRLARVEYVSGTYRTELFVSNKVTITIPA
jgi:hypothetical protein